MSDHCCTSRSGRLACGSTNKGLQLMTYWTAPAPARPVSRTLAAIATTSAKTLLHGAVLATALVVAAGSYGFAQQSDQAPAAPAAKPKPAKKPTKPPTPEAAPPPAAQMPAPQAPAGQQAQQPGQNGQQQVQLIYSPWTKFCLKGQPGQTPDPNAKQVCFTGKDARIESGMPVVAAVLIEPEGQERKI